MYRIIAALVLAHAITASAFGQNQPINEIPLFGGQKKNAAQLEADRVFIEEATKAAGSRTKAAEEIVKRGWDLLMKGQQIEATKRLNQGYLLDPENVEVYWGLAAIWSMRKNYDEAKKLFERAIELAPKNARIKSDLALSLMQHGVELTQKAQKLTPEASAKFEEAEKVLRQGARDDPSSALVHARLANVLIYAGKNSQALAEARESQRLGGEGLDPSMVKEIERRVAAEQAPASAGSTSSSD